MLFRSDPSSVAYMNMIYNILQDPKIDDKYAMSPKRFADCAMFGLELAYVVENVGFGSNPGIDTVAWAGGAMDTEVLPYLLEKAEWSQEIADFFVSFPKPKQRLKNMAEHGTIKDVVAQYR